MINQSIDETQNEISFQAKVTQTPNLNAKLKVFNFEKQTKSFKFNTLFSV